MVSLVPVPVVRSPRGMVCSVDHLASNAGVAMLRAGGSAADAAVAASAVLAVTSQHMCGMGGDLFAIVHDGPGAPHVLSAAGRAGSGADPQALRDEGHTTIPFRGDVRAATVPGCLDGWTRLHVRFGELPLSEVLRPAIELARDGFPASPLLPAAVDRIAHLPEAADYTARPIRTGTLIRRPGAASVLEELAEGGREAVFGGAFGQDLLDVGDGLFSPDDLAMNQAEWVTPLSLDVFGHRVWTVPPVSQGYLDLAGTWVAEHLRLPDDPGDPRWAHLMIEAAKAVGRDRPKVLFDGADGAALLAPARLDAALASVDPGQAADVVAPADPGDTMFLCAVDDRRRAVSLIQSNAGGWGCHLGLARTRIFLHNRGTGFSLEPGHPAELAPGRRPPHTLAPTLVTDTDGRFVACVGTEGGDAQPQIVQQLLVRLLHHDAAPEEALAAGRWKLTVPDTTAFDTWTGGDLAVQIEAHTPASWADELRRLGHRVVESPPWAGGHGHSHVILDDGECLAGAADPRAVVGAAQGW